MALKRVTMQDIADACGLSRNTVSKIFNGRGTVPEPTRKLVLTKAQELGYWQIPDSDTEHNTYETPKGNIALLTRHKLLSHNFGAFFITSFTDQICRSGYTMRMYEISPEEIARKQLPPQLNVSEIAGFVGIELFDKEYLEMVCSLGKPTVFVDGYVRASTELLFCDFISMENIASEISLVRQLIAAGARTIGFIGDIEHCNSFYERWAGLTIAMMDAGLPFDKKVCILEKDSELYGDTDWLLEKLNAFPRIPDAFVCANDYLAVHLMAALKRMKLAIPDDVMIVGFDGAVEATLSEPPLDTVQIPSSEIGRLAAYIMMNRIQVPDSPFRWTYVKTTPIVGGTIRR